MITLPVNSSMITLPCNSSMITLPGNSSMITLPVNTTMITLPGNSSMITLPCNSSMITLPCNSSMITLPCNSSMITLPGNSSMIKLPGNSSMVTLPVNNLVKHFGFQDNPADFSYFFDTSRRRTCYIAPERFVESSWRTAEVESLGNQGNDGPSNLGNLDLTTSEVKKGDLTPAMDIFSVG